MKLDDIEDWWRAAKENPSRTLGLILAAICLVILFGWAGAFGKRLETWISDVFDQQPRASTEETPTRSKALEDWLAEGRN